MVSPVRPSRESITLSSIFAQKGHFTRKNLLMLGRISEIRYQISAIREKGGRNKNKPTSTVSSFLRVSRSDCATRSTSADFGVDLFVLVLAHAAQIAERPSLSEKYGHAGERAQGKCDQVCDHGCGERRFPGDTEELGPRTDHDRLRPASDSRQLEKRTDQSQRQNQHGVLESQSCQLASKAQRYQIVDQND